MNPKFYAENQVERVFPYMDGVDWFIVGGPADGSEAQKLVHHYPTVKTIGIEPNPEFFKFQCVNSFPGVLLPEALWSERPIIKTLTHNENVRGASLVKYQDNGTGKQVFTTTLDYIDQIWGPFKNCGVWIDIEESELECLKGAHKLLNSKRIKFLNIEVSNANQKEIKYHLAYYGYYQASVHDTRHLQDERIISDIIYVRNGDSCA